MQICQYLGNLGEQIESLEEIAATVTAVKDYIRKMDSKTTEEELNSLEFKLYKPAEEPRFEEWTGPTYMVLILFAGHTGKRSWGYCNAYPT